MFRSGAPIRPHAAVFGFVFSAFCTCFNPSAHKRLILIATIVLTDAATARLPLNVITRKPYLGGIFAYVLVLLIFVYDLGSRRRVHRATVWAGVLAVIVPNLLVPIGSWGLACVCRLSASADPCFALKFRIRSRSGN